MRIRFWTLAAFAGALALAMEGVRAGEPATNPTLLELAPGRWVKIHEQKAGDAVVFARQEHGGSCFDSKRGRIVLFGSNTHGRDWKNSPFFFDVAALTWSRLYPDDARATYAVNAAGLPVAGEKGDHPWASHTFGALVYDSARDEVVDTCYPQHLQPGRFTDTMADLWPKIKRHPTWVLSLDSNAWTPLPCPAELFFPYAAEWDSDRQVVLGWKPDGVYELGGEPRAWKKVSRTGQFNYHVNGAYDAAHKALVAFGSNENRNDVAAFFPATGELKLMPTPGQRPPKDQHNPMAFDPGTGGVVVIVDRVVEEQDGKPVTSRGETWLYDLGRDAWTHLATADLPFAVGMNYNMEFDPRHGVMLLVAGGGAQPTAVWALRVARPDG